MYYCTAEMGGRVFKQFQYGVEIRELLIGMKNGAFGTLSDWDIVGTFGAYTKIGSQNYS